MLSNEGHLEIGKKEMNTRKNKLGGTQSFIIIEVGLMRQIDEFHLFFS